MLSKPPAADDQQDQSAKRHNEDVPDDVHGSRRNGVGWRERRVTSAASEAIETFVCGGDTDERTAADEWIQS